MSNTVIMTLRVVHIAFGAFWLGGTIALAFFLLPAIRSASDALDGQFFSRTSRWRMVMVAK